MPALGTLVSRTNRAFGSGHTGKESSVRKTSRNNYAPYTSRMIGALWPLFFVVLVACDQVTKALAPTSRLRLDAGSGSLWPSVVNRAFESSSGGAVLDVLGCFVVVAMSALVVLRLHRPLSRTGATAALAGLSSNLLDRLGLDHVTQGVRGRVVVNWFYVGDWRLTLGNVADFCELAGVVLLVASAMFLARRSLAARVRNVVPHRTAAARLPPAHRTATAGWTAADFLRAGAPRPTGSCAADRAGPDVLHTSAAV